MILDKLVSAIYNDIVGGLRGYHHNISISLELLTDDVIDERLQVIKEYTLRGTAPIKDLYLSINCIPVDCKDLERCSICRNFEGTPTAHFEIPLILTDFGLKAIDYIGSSDRLNPFIYYISSKAFNTYHKYRRRGKEKPYVIIDTTPNENGMYDCFLFNAPLMQQISITAIFKDPRLLDNYGCCNDYLDDNFSFINNEIKKRLVAKKLNWYRQAAMPLKPNDQTYNAG